MTTARDIMDRATSERDWMNTVIEYARTKSWCVAHFRSVPIQTRSGVHYATPVQADGGGFPDLILVRGGRVIAAELKSEKGKLSPEQQAWLDAFDEALVEDYCWRPSDWPTVQKVLT